MLALTVRIIKQYEQGVLFRLGRLRGSRAPGLRPIIPLVDVLHAPATRPCRLTAASPRRGLASTERQNPDSP